jgi:hypothetical protein
MANSMTKVVCGYCTSSTSLVTKTNVNGAITELYCRDSGWTVSASMGKDLTRLTVICANCGSDIVVNPQLPKSGPMLEKL